MEDCINPNESLGELLSRRQKLLRDFTRINAGKEWTNEQCDLDIELQKTNESIYRLEQAARSGSIIRLM